MNCEKCGKELKSNAKFCPQCGHKRIVGTSAAVGNQSNIQARLQVQSTPNRSQGATAKTAENTHTQDNATGGITDKNMYNRTLHGSLKVLVYFWYFGGVVMGITDIYLVVNVFKYLKYLKYGGSGTVLLFLFLAAFMTVFTVMLWRINIAIHSRDPIFLDMYYKTVVALIASAVVLWGIIALLTHSSFLMFLLYVAGELVFLIPAFAWIMFYFIESVTVYEYMGGDSYIRLCSATVNLNPWLKYEIRANGGASNSRGGYDLSSIAESYRSPAEVRSNTWKCGRCGRTNDNTVRTCACGVRKDQYYMD